TLSSCSPLSACARATSSPTRAAPWWCRSHLPLPFPNHPSLLLPSFPPSCFPSSSSSSPSPRPRVPAVPSPHALAQPAIGPALHRGGADPGLKRPCQRPTPPSHQTPPCQTLCSCSPRSACTRATSSPTRAEGVQIQLKHGSVVIAAISSCTSALNPSEMLTAALVAKKASERGLQVKPYVKASLAPGSNVETKYLEAREEVVVQVQSVSDAGSSRRGGEGEWEAALGEAVYEDEPAPSLGATSPPSTLGP
ncbi:unnamed protein product, partial [Closterium sp. NIES-54]